MFISPSKAFAASCLVRTEVHEEYKPLLAIMVFNKTKTSGRLIYGPTSDLFLCKSLIQVYGQHTVRYGAQNKAAVGDVMGNVLRLDVHRRLRYKSR
jgi:hypothetical protein